MKKRTVHFQMLILFFSFLLSTALSAQKLDKKTVEHLIQSKNFVFTVQNVYPMGGMVNQMMTGFDLRMIGDSMITYLPFFGRAYSAPYGQGGAFNFTSTKFEYTVKQRKKGGWEILIQPRDHRDIQQMNFTVAENGYASLQMTSNSRQPISYTGYLAERK